MKNYNRFNISGVDCFVFESLYLVTRAEKLEPRKKTTTNRLSVSALFVCFCGIKVFFKKYFFISDYFYIIYLY